MTLSNRDELRRLEQWLLKNRPEYLHTLNAGVAPEALDEVERTIDARLPDAVRAWFSWRDGQARNDSTTPGLLRDWRMLSLRDALREWRSMKQLFERGDFELHDWWRPRWFPLFARPQGDLLVVDLEGTFSSAGAIVEFWHDNPRRRVHAPSFEAWLGAVVRSFEANLWVSQEGDSDWWEVPEYEGLFERLLPAYVQTFDVSREKPLAEPTSTTTKEEWVQAFVDKVREMTPSELWGHLPEGWAALRVAAGETIEDMASMVESAPAYTRAVERGALAALAYGRGLAKARDLALAALEEDVPFALAEVVYRVGLADEVVRARAIARAEALAKKPLAGSAALLFAVAAELRSHDPARADALAGRAQRLTPMVDTRTSTKRSSGDAGTPTPARAKLDGFDFQSEYREGLLSSAECAEIVVELARDAIDVGDPPRARKLLADLERMFRDEISTMLAGAASALDQPEERPRKATRAELSVLALGWTPADLSKTSTRKLLLQLADVTEGEDGAFAGAVLDRVIDVMTNGGEIPLADSRPRFQAAVALALAAHGRLDEALALARSRWVRSEPQLLAQLMERLIEQSRTADAFALGHQLDDMFNLQDLLTLAPALPRLVPESVPTVRRALEAAATWAVGSADASTMR